MQPDRQKLEEAMRLITEAVDSGDLLTLSDIARVSGESKQTLSVHRSRGKIPTQACGIDRYSFLEDVVNVYPSGPGSLAFQRGKWGSWWVNNGRTSRGR